MGAQLSQDDKDSYQQQAHQPLNYGASSSNSPINKNNNNNYNYNNYHNNNNNNFNEPKEARRAQLKLPYNYEAILKDDVDSHIDNSSNEKLYQQLQAGVYFNGRKKKYWVDKKGNNCFAVFANGLKITWADTPTHWYFHTEQTSEYGLITVAQLRNVAWLEVHGKFQTAHLTPGVIYQVSFQIMLEYSSYGWEVPVKFKLTVPNGNPQEHQRVLKDEPKGEWIKIRVGDFKVSPEHVGEIEFSLYEIEGGKWKKGLILKSAIIEPKN